MTNKPIKLTAFLIILIGGIYIFNELSEFMKIDKCLDSGGSWNEETKECIHCESDFRQIKNAENYSTSAYFEIVNETSNTLDSVHIVPQGYKNENFIEIPTNYIRVFIADMSSTKNTDGHYHLSFLRGQGQRESIEFGNFTNGHPLEDMTTIIIEADTVIIFREFYNN
ncbi:hypothetical protein HNS38_15605 [Lentimicrobium sp. L6]|uniref:hypothetical protein n=1 Tax=Lentimicrobium sp. L6 TaxID=2735916 RepID=UPI0015526385|nr:hypothetical protein [Lentimicrobium sp. L6]NPD86199.1 hypothetical protein [Lentimicrobium sp. L6]